MLFRDHDEVHRRDRIDVVEGQHLGVLIHFLARYLTARNSAKDAVVAHLRLAFSSMPDTPSRRASSFSTSSALNPFCASNTMQWNHRSATSYTRCALSPSLEASSTSPASSITFFRMASSPLLNSLAT